MVAYQAESDLVHMTATHYKRDHDEGRTLIQSALAAPADIVVTDNELRVIISPLSSASDARNRSPMRGSQQVPNCFSRLKIEAPVLRCLAKSEKADNLKPLYVRRSELTHSLENLVKALAYYMWPISQSKGIILRSGLGENISPLAIENSKLEIKVGSSVNHTETEVPVGEPDRVAFLCE
jgi:hypothetical protein